MKLTHFSQVELKPVDVEGAEGTFIRWLIAEKDGAPNFAMRLFEIEHEGHTPYHKHAWEHVIYCLEGNGILVFEGNEYPFKADDSMYIDPEKMHQFRNVGEGKLKFLCMIPHENNYAGQDTKEPDKKKPVNPFAAGKANNC
jgi:quercetin dioxygenase-like cupin family protein